MSASEFNKAINIASVVDDFNTIVNGGFEARHEILARESSINAYNFNKALGIASAGDYRDMYITLLTCIVNYIDKSDSMCNKVIDDIRKENELLSKIIDKSL